MTDGSGLYPDVSSDTNSPPSTAVPGGAVFASSASDAAYATGPAVQPGYDMDDEQLGGGPADDDDAGSLDDDWGIGDMRDLREFDLAEVAGHASVRGPFQIHVLVAVIAVLVNLVIWFFVGTTNNRAQPWFLFVLFGFVITLAAHYYLFLCDTRKLLQLHMAVFVSVIAMLFVAWASSAQRSSTWWLIVLCGWGLVLQAHRSVVRLSKSAASRSSKVLHFARVQNLCISLFMFILFLDTHSRGEVCRFLNSIDLANATGLPEALTQKVEECDSARGTVTPWFIFPIFGTTTAYFILWWFIRGKRQLFTLHLGLYSLVNLLLFVVWMVSLNAFPWSILVAIVWGLGLGAHWYFFERAAVKDSRAAASTSDDTLREGDTV